jgi:hypothetical protein
METIILDGMQKKMRTLLEIAVIMHRKYHVVATNPPYMGSNGMNDKLSNFVKREYPDTKSDLSTVFMENTIDLCNSDGYMSMINIPVWMFLSGFENIRNKILFNNTIINLLHFGRGIFGADFGSTSFVIKAKFINDYTGLYRKLYTKQGSVDSFERKLKLFYSEYGKYYICQDKFLSIPGLVIAYNASKYLLDAFKNGTRIDYIGDPKQGLATADNNRFLRFWFEIAITKTGFSMDRESAIKTDKKWVPYNKGGGYRKWYGNNEYIINWEKDGHELKKFKGSVIRNPQYYFKPCLTWCKVTISGFSMRFVPKGFIFDVAGCSLFVPDDKMDYIHGFANSKVNALILSIISPTVNYEVGHIASLPIIENNELNITISEKVQENVAISRADWDSFETSWDFKRHPLIPASSIRDNSQAAIKLDDGVEANYNKIHSSTDGREFESANNI